jgi:hypothetical protein
MKRRLINTAAIASLLLCVGSVTLWGRSYWANEAVFFNDGGQRLCVRSSRGRATVILYDFRDLIFRERFNYVRWPDHGFFWDTWLEISGPSDWLGKLGIDYAPDARMSFSLGLVRFHYAYPTLLTMILPTWLSVWTWRGRKATAVGQCRVCGYDLRATPSRCPECGTVPR